MNDKSKGSLILGKAKYVFSPLNETSFPHFHIFMTGIAPLSRLWLTIKV
jgi:hypothetical protein